MPTWVPAQTHRNHLCYSSRRGKFKSLRVPSIYGGLFQLHGFPVLCTHSLKKSLKTVCFQITYIHHWPQRRHMMKRPYKTNPSISAQQSLQVHSKAKTNRALLLPENLRGLKIPIVALSQKMIHPPHGALPCLRTFRKARGFITACCTWGLLADSLSPFRVRRQQLILLMMIFLLQHFFLLATDLVLAMTLSCFFYAFVCVSVAFLTCCMIIFSFGTAERRADVRGRAIVILVSNSSIGRMFARNLDKAGFGVSAAQWSAQGEERTVTEECSSNKEVAQLHLTEDEYEKTVKTFIESHLSLKGNF